MQAPGLHLPNLIAPATAARVVRVFAGQGRYLALVKGQIGVVPGHSVTHRRILAAAIQDVTKGSSTPAIRHDLVSNNILHCVSACNDSGNYGFAKIINSLIEQINRQYGMTLANYDCW